MAAERMAGREQEDGLSWWLCPWGPTHSPDVRGFAHRGLLNDLRGHKLRGPVLAILWLCQGDFLGKAKVADFNVFPSRMHQQDVGGLLDRVMSG